MSFDSDIRATIRACRKKLSDEKVISDSKIISKKIISTEIFSKSTHIAAYISDENEVLTDSIFEQIKKLRKKLYLPMMTDSRDLLFYPINDDAMFVKNKHHIIEPIVRELPISVDQLDLLLIPVVSFDLQGNRLGRGAGCYDRALSCIQKAEKKPVLMGLAYEFQKVDVIKSHAHDVPMNAVVTEKEIYWFNR